MTDSDSAPAYRSAGVDLETHERVLAKVKKLARSTATTGVLGGVGGFGGLFQPKLSEFEDPILVASADGVGTKLLVARMAGDFSTVGRDLVNHCVNDILAQGAEPLFFLDYLGAGSLAEREAVDLIEGVAQGCKENGCALLGGETAEMPGFYQAGDYELVGFIVGLVDRKAILDGSRIGAKDLLLGLPSAGLHTNGYSLVRKILFDQHGLDMDGRLPNSKLGVAEVLLAPHLSYLAPLKPLLGHTALHGLVHVTGGGLTGNLPRVLPKGTHASIRIGAWEIPELFHLLQGLGDVATDEMFRVFNMGIGMVLLLDPEGTGEVLSILRRGGQRAFPIGTVQKGRQGVVYDLASEPAGEGA